MCKSEGSELCPRSAAGWCADPMNELEVSSLVSIIAFIFHCYHHPIRETDALECLSSLPAGRRDQ